MSGYLNNFVGYFLNFFKKDNPKQARDAIRRHNDLFTGSVYFTPPRRCSSAIEDRRFVEVLDKQQDALSSTSGEASKNESQFLNDNSNVNKFFEPAIKGKFLGQIEVDSKQANAGADSEQESRFLHDSHCVNKPFDPAMRGKFLDRNEVDSTQANERGDGMKPHGECCIYHESCNTVIEDRRLIEVLAKEGTIQKGCCSSTAGTAIQQEPRLLHDNRCVDKFFDPTTGSKFLDRGGANVKQTNERGDGMRLHRECCIYHDAAVGFSKEFPHVSDRNLKAFNHAPHSLRRSSSLESCWPTEDRKRLNSLQMFRMRHNPSPIENAGRTCLLADPVRDYPPFTEPLDLPRDRYSEGSQVSCMFAEDHRPKSSKIPVYRRKHRPVKVCKILPQQFESSAHREPECTCYREFRAIPTPRGWRSEGHAIYCPKSVVAYRSYINTKLENLFRVISKKKFCGNIIDAASHSRWMRLAGVGVDEDAACFKKLAKGRVALAVSEYKRALQQLCVEKHLDYWYLVRKMTEIEIGSGDSNSTNSTIPERKQTHKRSI